MCVLLYERSVINTWRCMSSVCFVRDVSTHSIGSTTTVFSCVQNKRFRLRSYFGVLSNGRVSSTDYLNGGR